jgi:membrane protease subunit (stomatin/prohibitin family)
LFFFRRAAVQSRAYGVFTFRVTDPTLFLRDFTGTGASFKVKDVVERINPGFSAKCFSFEPKVKREAFLRSFTSPMEIKPLSINQKRGGRLAAPFR